MPVHTSQDASTIVASLYTKEADPGMRGLIEAVGASSDHELADAIEADARERLRRGLPNSLSRYLDGIPNLTSLRIALDAAIEFAIRAAVNAGASEADAVRALVTAHPNLREAIETAFALSEGLASTTTLARSAGRPVPLQVPCDFGPRLPDGRRRYDVRQRLGVGSQGEVYLAADRQLSESDRPAWVAIKRMRPVLNLDAASQAAAEARKARRIGHPNVVRVFDRATDEAGMDYIVYEHVDDGDMAHWFAKRAEPVPTREAARLLAQICRGVHAAHLAGVVHCDLKPSNILLSKEAVPKVADFGVAAAIRSDAGRIPDATPVGNLAFTAPEQYRAEDGAQAIPADVYALGGLLYFLLTGRQPNGDNPAQVAARHTHPDTPAPSPQALRPDVDADLDAICRRALAPRPADRYASAHALADDLESWLNLRPIEWASPGWRRRVSLLAKRQPFVVSAAVLAFLGTVGGATGSVYFAMNGERRVLRERVAASEEVQRRQTEMLDEVRGNLVSTMRIVQNQNRGGLTLEWFPPLTILESVAGPFLFDLQTPGGPIDVWSGRVAKVEDLLKKSAARGQEFQFEQLLWHDAIAFWALRAGKFQDAELSLSAADPHWDKTLGPDDQWRQMRSGMHATATVLRHAAVAQPDGPSPQARAELEQAVTTLQTAVDLLDGDGHRRAIRILFLQTLRRAFDKDLLAQTKEGAEIQRRLVKIEELAPDETRLQPLVPEAPVPTH